MLAAQRSAAATAARPTTVENASLNETIRLLTEIVERDQNQPPIIVQFDPALKRLEEQMTAALESLGSMSTLDYILIAAIVLMGAGFFVLAVFMIAAASRRKKRGTGSFETILDTTGVTYFPGTGGSTAIIGSGRSQAPLLDFVDPGTMEGESRELAIHRHLLKAEKLNRMYEEVRNGALSWNTIRKYVGELEVSLRAEILKTVERKLEEGDLLENQSILPVLFPFLTDYDDYVREKAESLAQRALKSSVEEKAADGTDPDFLSLHTLMEIPRKLHVIFRNQVQTLITAKICRGMGSVLGLSAADRNLLYKSALVHDCGYLMLNQDKLSRIIINNEISVEDFKFVQTHAISGINYFKEIDLPEEMKSAIRSHHERNDGSGYPDGLQDKEIPLFAKIIGVAETFSALVSRRSYRDKLDMTHALAIVADGTRLKFDPSHVEALKEVVPSMGGF
jgi:HD-GYP domain-containing protein (c-di-GMP phosphodiesterase class II)